MLSHTLKWKLEMPLKSDWWLKYTQSNKNKVYELWKSSKNDIIAYTQDDNSST